MLDLVLIRHGETDWNRELRFQGHVDIPLNAVGQEQARRLGERLAGERFDGLHVSDLSRARETAAPAAGRLALDAAHDARWREQSFGEVDGLRVDDIQQRFPHAWSGWTRFQQDYAMPGGESARQFHARVMDAIGSLAKSHAPGARLLVVTHGGVLDMVYRTARSLGLDGPRQSLIPNAGISRVRYDGERFEIVDWADVAHLEGMPSQPVYNQQRFARDA